MHVVRHSQRETVAASLLDEQVRSVVPRVIVGEVRQVVADTDGREEQSQPDFVRHRSVDLTSPDKTVQMMQPMWVCLQVGSRSRTLTGDV